MVAYGSQDKICPYMVASSSHR